MEGDQRGPRQLRALRLTAAGGEHRRADRPSTFAELGERQRRMGPQLGGVEQRPEPLLDRGEVQLGAFGQAAAEDEGGGVEGVGQVDQADGDPPGELVDDVEGPTVALPRRGLDVLAAHQRRVAAGDLDDPPQPATDGGRAGQLSEARTGQRSAPSSRGARTGTAGRGGRRPCGRARR